MSSEKPFWEGKTLMEIQNLDQRVKVTMENGDVFIGKLIRRSRDTDGICHLSMQLDAHRTYLHVFSAESSDTPPVIPSYVDTIELVDDPEYERIDNIENVQVGDIFVADDGNQYLIDAADKDDKAATFRAYLSYAGEMWLSNCAFAYALRPKPKLPDHDGLWLDKDDNMWTMRDGSVQCTCIGADNWNFIRAWFSPDSVQVLNSAPFRPAKVVEA